MLYRGPLATGNIKVLPVYVFACRLWFSMNYSYLQLYFDQICTFFRSRYSHHGKICTNLWYENEFLKFIFWVTHKRTLQCVFISALCVCFCVLPFYTTVLPWNLKCVSCGLRLNKQDIFSVNAAFWMWRSNIMAAVFESWRFPSVTWRPCLIPRFEAEDSHWCWHYGGHWLSPRK